MEHKNEETNYVQVGETVACGHCFPNQGFSLPEKYNVQCICKCHSLPNEDSMGEFTPKHHQDQLEKIGYGHTPVVDGKELEKKQEGFICAVCNKSSLIHDGIYECVPVNTFPFIEIQNFVQSKLDYYKNCSICRKSFAECKRNGTDFVHSDENKEFINTLVDILAVIKNVQSNKPE